MSVYQMPFCNAEFAEVATSIELVICLLHLLLLLLLLLFAAEFVINAFVCAALAFVQKGSRAHSPCARNCDCFVRTL